MSTIIMNYCWPLQGMTVTQKAVLISLADNANDEGVCWPSIEKIAQRTCLSVRAVRNAIKWLEENQLLQKTERYGRSNIYTITPASYTPLQEMQPCTLRHQPRHKVHPPLHPLQRGLHMLHPEPSITHKEPQGNPQQARPLASPTGYQKNHGNFGNALENESVEKHGQPMPNTFH